MKKRGQIVGMPIVYISVAVMMGLVLYFGFTSMGKIFDAKETTEISKFVLDLQDEVEIVYNYDVGSSKKFVSNALPKAVNYACFFDPSQSISMDRRSLDLIDEQLFYYLDTSIKDNLFLVPVDVANAPYPDYYVENLNLKDSLPNPLCVPNTGKTEILLETYLEDNQVFVGANLL
jgi:hypothetical protein